MTETKCIMCDKPATAPPKAGLTTSRPLCADCEIKIRSFQLEAVLTALEALGGKGRG